MNNVFIVGFERSGTTLLRRLISMWPGFDKDVLHETKKLFTYKTRLDAEADYYDEYSHIKSGEKIPYYTNSDFIINYIEQFRKFWPDSIIFHIIRKPEDVALSAKRTFRRPTNITKAAHAEHVQKVVNYLSEENNVITIIYESLIQNPEEMVKLIYDRLGSVPSDDIIDKILHTREPWELDGKRMAGLRYNSKVGKVKHDK